MEITVFLFFALMAMRESLVWDLDGFLGKAASVSYVVVGITLFCVCAGLVSFIDAIIATTVYVATFNYARKLLGDRK